MKKVSLVLLMLIIINFICVSFFSIKVYAGDESDGDGGGHSFSGMSMDDYKSMMESGKTTVETEKGNVQLKASKSDSDVGSGAGKAGDFFSSLAAGFSNEVAKLVSRAGLYPTESEYSTEKTGLFTISSLIFGEYVLFNYKPYEISQDSLVDPDTYENSDPVIKSVDTIKLDAAGMRNVIVNVGVALSLPMVMIAIIKIFTSRTSTDLAAWKKILTRWFLCIFLMYFYHYILITMDTISDVLMNTLWDIRLSLENADYRAFETTVETSLLYTLTTTGGITYLAYAIELALIVILQGLFLIKYAIRVGLAILLNIFAPVVILMHSIFLMIGKNSNVLGTFFKTYTMCAFIQPIHALVYIIFFFSLSEIAINVPLLGIVLLYALYRTEKIVKAMFGWDIGTSILSLRD